MQAKRQLRSNLRGKDMAAIKKALIDEAARDHSVLYELWDGDGELEQRIQAKLIGWQHDGACCSMQWNPLDAECMGESIAQSNLCNHLSHAACS